VRCKLEKSQKTRKKIRKNKSSLGQSDWHKKNNGTERENTLISYSVPRNANFLQKFSTKLKQHQKVHEKQQRSLHENQNFTTAKSAKEDEQQKPKRCQFCCVIKHHYLNVEKTKTATSFGLTKREQERISQQFVSF